MHASFAAACLTLNCPSPRGHLGLWLDADLYHGTTSKCSTFNNLPLSSKQDFTIQNLEVWAFEWASVPHANIHTLTYPRHCHGMMTWCLLDALSRTVWGCSCESGPTCFYLVSPGLSTEREHSYPSMQYVLLLKYNQYINTYTCMWMARTVYDIREAFKAEDVIGGQICHFEASRSNHNCCLHRGDLMRLVGVFPHSYFHNANVHNLFLLTKAFYMPCSPVFIFRCFSFSIWVFFLYIYIYIGHDI